MNGKEKLLLGLLLLFALFLRLYNLENRLTFDWDQENFAWQAKQLIVDHKLTLIGAEQSVGGIHLGPFYNYVSGFFYLIFGMNPIAGGITAIFFGLLTILTLFFVGSRLFNKRVGFVGALIYTISFPMIGWDIISWNLNPLYVLSLLSVYCLFKSLSDERYLFILSVLLGLGFHTHLTTTLLCLLCLVVYIYRRPKFRARTIIVSLIIFIITLSPLIAFEIRHDFHNFRQSLGLLSLTQNTFPEEKFKFITMANMIKNELFSFATFPLANYLKPIVMLFFWFIFLSARVFAGINKKFIDIGLLLVFLVFLTFSIYPGHVTEYYLSVLTPIAILTSAFMIELIFNKGKVFKIFIIILSAVFILSNLNGWYSDKKTMSLKNKEDAILYIIQKNDNKPFRFSITSLPGYDTGYKYLLWYYRAKVSEDLKYPVYTIVAPSGAYGIKPLKEFHGVGVVWNEPAPQ